MRLLRDVGVVVVTYNSAGTVAACLRALPVTELAGVVVVDNASSDDTRHVLRQHPQVRVIGCSHNIGYGAACNVGADALPDAKMLCFLNPDAVLTTPGLRGLVDYLDAHPDCALVGPRLVDADGEPAFSSGERGTVRTELRYAIPRRLVGLTADRRHDPTARRSGAVGYVEGACLLVDAAAFRAVGGFDPAFFLFFEELDLAERLRATDRTTHLVGNVTVSHTGGHSRAQLPDGARGHYVWSTVRYLRKHRGAVAATVYRWLAGGWWWYAGHSGRLDSAATAAWRAALHLRPPPPTRPDQPRLLLVSTEPPWPARAGAGRRLAAIVAALDPQVDTVVFSTVREPSQLLPPQPERVWVVRRSGRRLRSLIAMTAGLGHGRPLFTGFYIRRRVCTALRRAITLANPDVVLTHEIAGPALVARCFPTGRTLLDLHNVEHDLFAQLPGLRWRVDAPRLRRWAGRELPGYAAVSTVSAADRDAYAAVAPAARLLVAPNGAELPARARPDPGGRRALLLGDLGYPANREGLRFLLDEVLPRLGAPVRIRHVGGFDRIPEHPQLEAAGWVADLTSEWAAATVLAVPLRHGGGSRLKVLEAFAMGVPVVSTEVGVAGLELTAGVHAEVASSPAAFAAGLEALLDDPLRRKALAAAARQLVVERYQWDRTLRPLVAAALGLARQ